MAFSLFLDVVKFWFIEAPLGLLEYFSSFNNALLKVFSFQILARTFFKPWKNEYRKGLVEFSILIGICIKSIILLFDLLLLLVCIGIEIVIMVGFILWPFATMYLLLT